MGLSAGKKMNTGYCDYFPREDIARTEMWQIFANRKAGWYFWYAIILDEDRKLNLYPGIKYHGYASGERRATVAQQHRLIRLLFKSEFLLEP
jgi:hypothetical protein